MKLGCLDVYVAANAFHTVFMMETEIGYGLKKLLLNYNVGEAGEKVSVLFKWKMALNAK